MLAAASFTSTAEGGGSHQLLGGCDGGVPVLGGVPPHVGHDQQALAQVVEHHELAGEHQVDVWHAEVVGAGGRQLLDEADDVIAQVARRAREQRRQPVQVRCAQRVEQCLERGQRIPRQRRVAYSEGRVTRERDLAVACGHLQKRRQADKGPPPPALAMLDGLQEERRAVAAQPVVDRDGRLQVGKHLAPDGHDAMRARKLDELLARRPVQIAHDRSGRWKHVRSPV
jgi:hypothetical protein